MTRRIISLLINIGLRISATLFPLSDGRFSSKLRLPVNSSTSTTPKLYISHFSFRRPFITI
ncbi:hypothetical protein Hanom_Chr06g00577791 [Helianthus anomalus]